MRRTSPLSPIVLMLLLMGACGCSSPGTTRPMTVAVRDKLTGDPVASARVDARAVNFFAPMEVPTKGRDAILDSSPPPLVRGVTGPDGTVRMAIVAGHPVQVIVMAAGYDVQVVDLERHPADTGEPSDWLDANVGLEPEAPRRVQVRFLPTQR